MMKKYFLLMLIAFPLTCFFTACGNDDEDKGKVVESCIGVVNDYGVTIYYWFINNYTELAVSSGGYPWFKRVYW